MNPGYKLFLETLNQRCQHAQSGVLHLYTAENHYGRMALAAGEIKHIALHTARGMTALPALLNAAIRSHRFEPAATLPPMDDLLDTEDILAMLGSQELDQTPAPPGTHNSPRPPARSAPRPVPRPWSVWR